MKRLLVLLALLFLSALRAEGQSTTVSGSVIDTGGQAWLNGTYKFEFVPNPQYPAGPYTWTGGTLQTTIGGVINGIGTYTASIPSNSAISPIGSKWTLTVCPLATWPCYTLPAFTVTGATQTTNVTPPAIAIDLTNPPPNPARAYVDANIFSAVIGSYYYNLTDQGFRVCQAVNIQSCTLWAAVGNGGSPGQTFPRLDQVLDQNTSRFFNQGTATVGFSNGTFDLSGETGFLIPTPCTAATATFQFCVDSFGNVQMWNGAAGVVALVDPAILDGQTLTASVVGGKITIVGVTPNSGGGSTTNVTAILTNITNGQTVCWDDVLLTFVNCSAGIPVTVNTGATYTYDAILDRGSAIIANNAGSQTYTLGQVGTATDEDANWFTFQLVKNGILTINTTTSIFDDTGTSSETLLQGEGCTFLTDPTGNGTIYPKCHEPRILAGSGINLTRTPYFLTISANPGAAVSNGLISGGGVAWTGSGLAFDVGAATYSIAGTTYSSTATTLTLSAADPTNPRIDMIAVNDSGAAVIIAGTPAPSPSAPSVDPTSQLALTFVTVPANSTTPVASVTLIYKNNVGAPTEFNCTSTANFNCASTNNPISGATKSLEATTAVSGNSATLTIGSGTFNLASYDTLAFYIRNKATWPAAKTLQVFFRNGSTNSGVAVSLKNGVYGFDQTNTTTYQLIAIPVSAFQTGVGSLTNLRFQVNGSGGSIGFYLGNIQLQTGFRGGGGSGGGGSFILEVNGNNQQSTVNFTDTASITWACTTSGGVSTCQGTSTGAGSVTSITGDTTIFNNSASTGAVTLTKANQNPNLVLAGPTSGAAANVVQTASGTTPGATSLSVAFPNPVGAGHLIVVAVESYNLAETFSDNNGNTYSAAISGLNWGTNGRMYYTCNANAGATTVTDTVTGGSNIINMHIMEISGNATTSCLDTTGTANISGGTNVSVTTSGSVAQATEAVVAVFSANQGGGGSTTVIHCTASCTDLQQTTTTAAPVNPIVMRTAIGNASTGLSGTQTLSAYGDNAPSFWHLLIAPFKLNTSASAAQPTFRSLVSADIPFGVVQTTGTPTANKMATFSSASVVQAIDLPEVSYFPAAGCPNNAAVGVWSYAASTWTAACRAGTNNLGGALQLIPNTGGAAQFRMQLPLDWDTASQPYVRIEYGSGTNTTGTVIWTIATSCTKNDGSITDDGAFNSTAAFGTQTMAAATRGWSQSGQLTTVTSGNNCIPGGGMIIRVTLSGTATAVINAYQAVVTVPRKPVVQGE